MIVVAGGDSGGMSETDKTSQPRALATGDGLSLTPRKASAESGNQFYFIVKKASNPHCSILIIRVFYEKRFKYIKIIIIQLTSCFHKRRKPYKNELGENTPALT